MSNFAPSSFGGPLPDLPDLLKRPAIAEALRVQVFRPLLDERQREEAAEVARILALPTKPPEVKR